MNHQNMKLMQAVINNYPGMIRKIMTHHYNSKFPTITEKHINNAKLVCVYNNRQDLLKYFDVPEVLITH